MTRYRPLVVKAAILLGAGFFLLHAFHAMRAETCPLDPFAPADVYPCGSEL